jgi:hypothetical protein
MMTLAGLNQRANRASHARCALARHDGCCGGARSRVRWVTWAPSFPKGRASVKLVGLVREPARAARAGRHLLLLRAVVRLGGAALRPRPQGLCDRRDGCLPQCKRCRRPRLVAAPQLARLADGAAGPRPRPVRALGSHRRRPIRRQAAAGLARAFSPLGWGAPRSPRPPSSWASTCRSPRSCLRASRCRTGDRASSALRCRAALPQLPVTLPTTSTTCALPAAAVTAPHQSRALQ